MQISDLFSADKNEITKITASDDNAVTEASIKETGKGKVI